MATEVGSAWISVLPSTAGFGKKLQGDIGKDVGDTGKKSGSIFGGAFKLAAAAAAGIGAISFVKDAIAEARESQKVAAQTAQVIKSTGGVAKVTAGDVDKLATSISNKTGIDDEAIASASNLLLTFTGVRNEVGKGNDVFNQATQIATDMGAALGTDASGSAIQLGKALNDPIKGISALSRVGVSFTDQQKAQIKTLVEHNDTLGAQKIILGELSKEFGGSAAAQATAGEKAAVAFGNLKEAVGTALLPVLDRLMGFVTSTVIPGLYSLGGFLSATLGPAFSAIKDAVTVFFNAFMGRSELGEFDGVLRTINNAAILFREGFDFARESITVFFNAFTGKSELGEFDGALRVVNDTAIKVRDALEAFIGNVVQLAKNAIPGALAVLEPLAGAFLAVGGYLADKLGPAIQAVTRFFAEHKTTTAVLVGTIVGLGAAVLAVNALFAAGAAVTAAYAAAKALFTVATNLETGAVERGAVAQVAHRVAILAGAAATGVTFVASIVAATARIVAQTVATVASTAATLVARGAVAAWTAAQWLLNAALTANPIGLIVVGVAALVAGVILAYKHSETFRNIVQGLWDVFKKYTVLGQVISHFDDLRRAVGWVVDKVQDLVSALGKIKMPKLDLPGGGLLKKLPGFASGGTLPAGWSWTGEQGPELVYSARGGERVFSRDDSLAMLSAPSGAVQNNYITVPPAADPRGAARAVVLGLRMAL